MRAILDVNVLISALLSRDGSPARLLGAWHRGAFELIVSPLLLEELERALTYPKLRRLVSPDEASTFVAWLGRSATVVPDPAGPPPARSIDPDDDYLVALAADQQAFLVSGDAHLLDLESTLPILSPAAFRAMLETGGG